MTWDEWRGSLDGRQTMLIKHLVARFGLRIDLHKFVSADDPGCFHTHPSIAVRIVLWGGYVEEMEDGRRIAWLPGNVGIVPSAHCHRVSQVINGRASYSLWLRGRVCADVELRGPGWPREAIGARPERN